MAEKIIYLLNFFFFRHLCSIFCGLSFTDIGKCSAVLFRWLESIVFINVIAKLAHNLPFCTNGAKSSKIKFFNNWKNV